MGEKRDESEGGGEYKTATSEGGGVVQSAYMCINENSRGI